MRTRVQGHQTAIHENQDSRPPDNQLREPGFNATRQPIKRTRLQGHQTAINENQGSRPPDRHSREPGFKTTRQPIKRTKVQGHQIANQGNQGSRPPDNQSRESGFKTTCCCFKTWPIFFISLSMCLSGETKSHFSMPGEVKDLVQ